MVGQVQESCNKPANILSRKKQLWANTGLFAPLSSTELAELHWKYCMILLRTHDFSFCLRSERQAHCKSSGECGKADLFVVVSSLLKPNVSWTQPTLLTEIPSSGNRPGEAVSPTQISFAKPATTEPCIVVKQLASDWMNIIQTIIRNNGWKLARQPATTARETAELLAYSVRRNDWISE